MKILKMLLSFLIIFILFLHSVENDVYAKPNGTIQNPIRIAVFLNNFNDPFFSTVRNNLEDVQKEHENKVEFTFFDAKGNQGLQNEHISNALSEYFDLFVINPVSSKTSDYEYLANKVFEKNIPIILDAPPNPQLANFIKAYNRAVIIGGDDIQSGILQGKILINIWNDNKKTIDKNKDNIMQYILLRGPADNLAANSRTKYALQTINQSGIKTQELLSFVCNWNKECAKTSMESGLLNFINKTEVIISNNDAMAIGAIEALQKYGYNKGDNSKYIPVVGVDALPEAQELIKQGIMAGTVVQDPRSHADAIYAVGLNLVSGANPISGTNYKFDESGNTIKLPYYEYTKST